MFFQEGGGLSSEHEDPDNVALAEPSVSERAEDDEKMKLRSVLNKILDSMKQYGNADPTTNYRTRLVRRMITVVEAKEKAEWKIDSNPYNLAGHSDQVYSPKNFTWLGNVLRKEGIQSAFDRKIFSIS